MKHTRRGIFGLVGGAISAALLAAGVKRPKKKSAAYLIHLPEHWEWEVVKPFHRGPYSGVSIRGHPIVWDPTLDEEQGLC